MDRYYYDTLIVASVVVTNFYATDLEVNLQYPMSFERRSSRYVVLLQTV